MTNSPSPKPESESNNKNGDSQLSSPGTRNDTTSNGHTQRARWKVLIEEEKAEMARAAREAEATQTKRNPAGQAVAPGNQRGSRPSEQHSSRTLEGETLNGVTHPESYADAIPDVNTEKPESVRLSDSIVENVIGHADPLVVFPRWGKGDTPRSTSGDEVQFRCPTPSHTDTNPSASLNTKTGLWVCFGCEASGDIYTLGGLKFGMDERSSDLPALKRKMAEDLTGKPFIEHGPYSVLDIPAVRELVESENQERERREAEDNRALQEKLQAKEVAEQQHAADLDEYMNELSALLNDDLVPEPERPAPDAPTDTPAAATTDNHTAPHPEPVETQSSEPTSPAPTPPAPGHDDLMVPPKKFAGYDELLKPGTFLSEFYNSAKGDKNPNDFHFFHGLVGISLAIGENVTLADTTPVRGNMFICFVAGTGTGKSQSSGHLEKAVEIGLPWDPTNRYGAKLLETPSSGETLIDSMAGHEYLEINPITGAATKKTGHIKGWLQYDELATLVKQMSRTGTTIDSNLTTMYDGKTARTRSRGSGIVEAFSPYLTMTSNIPKKTMQSLFSQGDAASGFLNRFIFVSPSEYKEQEMFPDVRVPDYDYLGSKLSAIADWATNRMVLTLDVEARELVEKFFRIELVKYAPRGGADVDSMMVRLDVTLKKFMLLFAANEMSDVIKVSHVEKAIKLYWIAKPNAEETSDSIGKSAEAELEDAIAKKVTAYFIKHAEPLTAGQIWGKVLQIGYREAKRLGIGRRGFDDALRNLVRAGDLDEVKPPKGDNRTRTKYKPGPHQMQ